MKPFYWILLLSMSCFATALAQQNTDVFLADLDENKDTLKISPLINISNNDGYDNQPSFLDDDTILFSSTRNNQTDIALYTISTGEKTWISSTPEGSEYSPLKIPGKEAISAIRLDIDGLQRLYQYDIQTGVSEKLLEDLKVGYHVWYNDHILVCTILVENRMDLVLANLKEKTNYTIAKNVGRSLHKIPKTDLVSYISKAKDKLEIKSLNPLTKVSKTINYLENEKEDIAWLSPQTILASSEKAILKATPDVYNDWELFHQFEPLAVYNVSRLAISPNGKKIALVAQPSPHKIVQKQVDSYNAGDLNAFVNCYAENVLVSNFPADTLYVGHDKMRNNYSNLSPDNKVYEVAVVNRIVIGNKVIDEEKVTQNGKFQQMQVALYEVNNNAISSMRFIFDKENLPDPETIVQKQLDAYNARDIDGFMETYSEDISIYNFPTELRTDDRLKMQEGYGNYFETTPDLKAVIKNRIVIGNIVIDKEEVTANGSTFNAVAIYEVENGKIAKVTFLR